MSISETVARLAKALQAHLVAKSASADVIAMLELVAEMPAFVRDARLDLWERKVNATGYDRGRLATDRTYRAAHHVYELGRMNLFGAIEIEKTKEAYAEVVTELRELGVTGLAAAEPVVLDDW